MDKPLEDGTNKLYQSIWKKYIYIAVIALILLFNISYGYTFFIQNKVVSEKTITVGDLSVTMTDGVINLSGLSPSIDINGMNGVEKSMTFTNTSNLNGRLKLVLTGSSGVTLDNLRYAIKVNGIIEYVGSIPLNGEIYDFSILKQETVNIRIVLWIDDDYNGAATTFVGEVTTQLTIDDMYITDYIKAISSTSEEITVSNGKYWYSNNSTTNYVWYNCANNYDSGANCTKWRIVGVDNDRLVLTETANFVGASSRVDSGSYIARNGIENSANITKSVSNDANHYNVYLAKTVKISRGDGTVDNPFSLKLDSYNAGEHPIIAYITYVDNPNEITQPIYYARDNYISEKITSPGFFNWSDTLSNTYAYGQKVAFNANKILNANYQANVDYLYDVLKDDYLASSSKVALYTGQHLDSYDGTGSQNIYYYHTNNSSDADTFNNHVIFANICWRMIRTTDTGGIKLLYNGVPDNGTCTTSRSSHYGVVADASQTTIDLRNTNYYYSSLYSFNESTGVFTLVNPTSMSWTVDSSEYFHGLFTCLKTTTEGCTSIYNIGNIVSWNNNVYARKYQKGSTPYYQIGSSPFNEVNSSYGLGVNNYMYNPYKIQELAEHKFLLNNMNLNISYYYGDNPVWNSTTNMYEINNAFQISSVSDVNSIIGKYFFPANNQTVNNGVVTMPNNLAHVVGYVNDKVYYWLAYGGNINNYDEVFTVGDSISRNQDGTSTLSGNVHLVKKSNWISNYNSVVGKYLCAGDTVTCVPYTINSTSPEGFYRTLMNGVYKFGEGVVYNPTTGKYSLDTSKTIREYYNWPTYYNQISDTHYTCFSSTNECDSSVYYFIESLNNYGGNYIILDKGETFETMVSSLSGNSNSNQTSSTVKNYLESWYYDNLLSYNSYIEDAVYCAERKISPSRYGSIGPNNAINPFAMWEYDAGASSYATLNCSNIYNAFSTSNKDAELTYPIGLLTASEALLSNNQAFRNIGTTWMTMTPYQSKYSWSTIQGYQNWNSQIGTHVASSIRPAITLKATTVYSSGNGTDTSPYVIS